MKFDPLFLSPQWMQEFHTKYPHGMSVLENIIEWVNQTNTLIEWANITPEKTEQILRQWQESGLLDVIIDAALQTQIDDVDKKIKSIHNPDFMVKSADIPKDLQATQGFVYDSLRNLFYMAVIDLTSENQKIKVLHPVTLEVIATHVFTGLGHANTITYVPDLDRLYIVTDIGKISIVNPENMIIVNNITVAESITALSYDKVLDQFFGLGYTPGLQKQYIYKYSKSLSLLDSFEIEYIDKPTNGFYSNNGDIIVIHFESISCYDKNGLLISKMHVNYDLEFEDIAEKNGVYYFNVNNSTTGDTFYEIWKYDNNVVEENTLRANNTSDTGKVKENIDLNTLTSEGIYRVSASSTPEVLNYPTAIMHGILDVKRLPFTTNIVQTMHRISTTHVSDIRTRMRLENGVWTPWKIIGCSQSPKNFMIGKYYGAGFITGGQNLCVTIPMSTDLSVFNSVETISGVVTLRQGGNYIKTDFLFNLSDVLEVTLGVSGIVLNITIPDLDPLTVNNDSCGVYILNLNAVLN